MKIIKSLLEIQKYCQYIVDRTNHLSMEEYLENFDLCLAVERALINVGVAAWRVREDDPDL